MKSIEINFLIEQSLLQLLNNYRPTAKGDGDVNRSWIGRTTRPTNREGIYEIPWHRVVQPLVAELNTLAID